ncbi:DNA alkylation repair protein [Rhodobacter sp. KR11]|uniref:DNA alkylation repair protein n=1 Tax=Rhodobacter sp. KR11 TaxID=2974588 RepID=UPI0022214F7A|nr:DNA alkylation repair protein [Rhodobacter sp. KR11]MCW1917774.1 DNA alkylation repair protein [Rhodobacter sp. KR11]
MTPNDALAALHALADPAKAEAALAYHKTPRTYFGVSVPQITDLAKSWREGLDTAGRVQLAGALWESNIHEARVAAAKLLTQARIADDAAVWGLIASWVPSFDGWAIADQACDAGERRLVADPSRLDEVEAWTGSEHMWTRRAALVITLPWTKQNFPKTADLAIRDRVLGWAAGYVSDPDWFIQKAVAWWLRDLSKHDPDRTRAFLEGPGQGLKPWARAEAARHLS